MTFAVTLSNGAQIKHEAKDGCTDRDVIVHRLKRAGWKVVSAIPVGE
jgi:hypothetical protein